MRSVSRHWWRFLAARIVGLIGVVVFLAFLTFFMVRLAPGDPAVYAAGLAGSSVHVAEIRHQLGLDTSVWHQLTHYLTDLVHFNFGKSYFYGQPVSTLLRQESGYSLELAGFGVGVVLVFALPLGMLAAAFTQEGRHKRGEVAFVSVSSLVGSLPEYLTATVLAFFFAVQLRFLPIAGAAGWKSLVLPVAAISLRPTAILMRIVRVETLNVLAQDFMRTARSKRLPARLLYLRHALPNVATAALTIGGILFTGLIGGAVIVENVFARPGLGTSLVSAVLNHDYPLIQGLALELGVIVVVVNMLVDVALAAIDPRSLTRQA